MDNEYGINHNKDHNPSSDCSSVSWIPEDRNQYGFKEVRLMHG